MNFCFESEALIFITKYVSSRFNLIYLIYVHIFQFVTSDVAFNKFSLMFQYDNIFGEL
jgi:hypothetical protein